MQKSQNFYLYFTDPRPIMGTLILSSSAKNNYCALKCLVAASFCGQPLTTKIDESSKDKIAFEPFDNQIDKDDNLQGQVSFSIWHSGQCSKKHCGNYKRVVTKPKSIATPFTTMLQTKGKFVNFLGTTYLCFIILDHKR